VRVPVSSGHGIAGCGKSLFFRRSGLEPRRKVLALNGLQPLKKACSFFAAFFRKLFGRAIAAATSEPISS
jgi:hypothetical protein